MNLKCKTLSRRQFIELTGASTLGLMMFACDSDSEKQSEVEANGDAGPDASSDVNENLNLDIVLKGGQVYLDGLFVPSDIGIYEGSIVKLDPTLKLTGKEGTQIVDCSDMYVSPGWVDFHVHIGNLGVALDTLGAPMGVTALLDAGTWGAKNFDQFMDDFYNKNPDQIDIFTLINLREDGLTLANNFVPHDEKYNDAEGAANILGSYSPFVKGLKCRTDGSLMNKADPLLMVRETAALGTNLDVPVMYHFNDPPPTALDLLDHTKPGDIITHCFRPIENSILAQDETVLPQVLSAKKEGLLFDVGHGKSSFSFQTAMAAIKQGFTDFTISSDIHLLSQSQSALTFANVLSKFLICGLTLEQIVDRVTAYPRRWLDLEWQIAESNTVDLTVFSLAKGDFTYVDSVGKEKQSNTRIVPEYAIVKGNVIRAGQRDRELFLDTET